MLQMEEENIVGVDTQRDQSQFQTTHVEEGNKFVWLLRVD